MSQMTKTEAIYSNRLKGLIRNLRDIMLKTSLWGVFDISLKEQRYEIIEAIEIIQKEEIFKKYGFNVEIIDGMNFVRKLPWFDDNKEFIKKHSLYLNDNPNYPTYLKYMHDNRLKYLKK